VTARTLENLETFLAAELERYKVRALAELADADPYLAGHLAGNINALVTVRAWLGPAPAPVPSEPDELTNAQRRENIAGRVARRNP
jgi:folate-binding Fe-S cluster repair protein YgfZ